MATISQYHAAGHAALWCGTWEPTRAVAELGAQLRAQEVEVTTPGSDPGDPPVVSTVHPAVYAWDCARGVLKLNGEVSKVADAQDPIQALNWFNGASEYSVLFLHNVHRFTDSVRVVQAIINATATFKQQQKMVVGVVPPGSALPPELDRVFVPFDHNLPTRDQLREVVKGLQCEVADLDSVVEAAAGLTRDEAENAASLSYTTRGEVQAADVTDQKAAMLKKSAGLKLEKFSETFADVGGMENLKRFCAKVIRSPRYRGVVLTGVPGTGKSRIAKALGAAAGLPVISLDVGAVFGSKVGQTEAQMRAVTAIVDAFGKCILYIDEIEKGFAGMQSSGSTDGGTTARAIGTFLTWLNDRPEGKCFVVATCNDYTKLPPEFLRAERWDAMFFVDCPIGMEISEILKIHCAANGITAKHGPPPDLTGWTGAEIATLCRTAVMLDCTLTEAAVYVPLVKKARGAEVEALRAWAKDRMVQASASVPVEVGGASRKLRTSA